MAFCNLFLAARKQFAEKHCKVASTIPDCLRRRLEERASDWLCHVSCVLSRWRDSDSGFTRRCWARHFLWWDGAKIVMKRFRRALPSDWHLTSPN